MLRARMQQVTAAEQRAAPRRLVNLSAHLRGSVAEPCDVRVLDLSAEGCRISPVGSLVEGAQAWLKLPGIEALGCSVAWTDAEDAGCMFHRHLNASEIEYARRSQTPVRSEVFGVKGAGRPR